jgi:hypothetical protein
MSSSTLLSVFDPSILDAGREFTFLHAVGWFGPGLVVGVLVALGHLRITYRQIWLFAILSWLASFGIWMALGLTEPWKQQFLALGAWVLGSGFAAAVAYRWG